MDEFNQKDLQNQLMKVESYIRQCLLCLLPLGSSRILLLYTGNSAHGAERNPHTNLFHFNNYPVKCTSGNCGKAVLAFTTFGNDV